MGRAGLGKSRAAAKDGTFYFSRSIKIAPQAGERRTVQLPLEVGRKAELGQYKLKVELEIGGRTATRTVKILVAR